MNINKIIAEKALGVVSEANLRLVKTYKHESGKTAKVYKDSEWGEHRVKLFDKDGKHVAKADYHTDDKDDAHDTAQKMLREAAELNESDNNPHPPFPKETMTGRSRHSACGTASVHEFKVGDKLHTASSVVGHGWSDARPDTLESYSGMGKITHAREYHVHHKDTGELISKHDTKATYKRDNATSVSMWHGVEPYSGAQNVQDHPIKVYDKVTGEHLHTLEKREGDTDLKPYHPVTGEYLHGEHY